jgi:hypothetical protein
MAVGLTLDKLQKSKPAATTKREATAAQTNTNEKSHLRKDWETNRFLTDFLTTIEWFIQCVCVLCIAHSLITISLFLASRNPTR